MRILVPKESQFQEVEVVSAGEILRVPPDISDKEEWREAGVLVEVNPGQTKEIIFSWRSDKKLNLSKNGEYHFYWRKQAGTDKDNVSIKLSFPGSVRVVSDPVSALTQGNVVGYNTSLSRDFISRVYW